MKFRYGLGYETLCREVADSIAWRRFCRIPLDGSVPHSTTLMKLTTRCGSSAVEGLNEALLAKAVDAKVLRTSRLRVDTTVVPSNVAYPTDSGLLAKAIRRIPATGKRIQAAGGARSRTAYGGCGGGSSRRRRTGISSGGFLITAHPPPFGTIGLALFVLAVVLYLRSQTAERTRAPSPPPDTATPPASHFYY